jgi:hypothetical protein
MSDEIKNNEDVILSPEEQLKKERGEKAQQKLSIVKKLKEISGNDKWTLTQQLLQEVVAKHIIENPGSAIPKTPTLVADLKLAVEERYKEDEEMKTLLLDSIPAQLEPVRVWMKKEGWEEAVWSKIRDSGLFSKERRAAMINALYHRGMERDTVAAKIYLQMSGDFVEKSEVTSKDSTMDKFREINSILHKKRTSES